MISKKIKSLRVNHGLTQAEMGKLIGCSAARISMYESGKANVTYEIVKSYAKRFGCHMNYLLSDELPLMDEPPTIEDDNIVTRIPALRNLALPPVGNNVWNKVKHPYIDNPVGRKAWRTKDKNGSKMTVILMEVENFRDGDHIVAVLDGATVMGYYYIDENRSICIKTKPKGEKGNRNLRIGLEKGDEIAGIVELIINE